MKNEVSDDLSKRNNIGKVSFREKASDWILAPEGKIRGKIKLEAKQEISKAILNPIAWFKGVDLPEGHITPWELFLFMLSAALSCTATGFVGKQDFLFKEFYHISPNMLSVGGVVSSLWDAANDPFLGSFMDRKRTGPKQWRTIMRISAVTGHTLNVIKMFDGGMSAWQHVALLIFCNCLQDIIGTLDTVSGQKLRAGISPFSQQRSRTQVWTNVGGSIGYPLSTIPLLLMGLKDVFHFNDYQIIFMGACIMLPFNIVSSFLITFIKQRVNFRPGAPVNSLPCDPSRDLPNEKAEPEEEERDALYNIRLERIDAAEKEIAEKEMLKEMSRAERKAYKAQKKAEHKERFKRGEYEIDPNTGEPKLSIWESFSIVKHNKYFIANTIANFVVTFTPYVDPILVYRYIVPKFKFFGKEVSGEMMWLIHAQVAGTFVTVSKPFSRQIVNFLGGPIRALQTAHIVNIIGYLSRFLLGCNKMWKLIAIMLIEAVTYVFDDASSVANNMMSYEMLDYVELKTGLRSEGVTMAVDALFQKTITNNIGTITGNAFLEWTGYTGGYLGDNAALPEKFAKYMWPMYTLSNVFDGIVWLIARSTVKHTPEDRERIEAALQERRKAKEAEEAEAEEAAATSE